MRKSFVALLSLHLLLVPASALAQISGPMFPGPGMIATPPPPVATANGTYQNTTTTCSITTTVNVSVGQLIVITVSQRGTDPGTVSFTDSAGTPNTYTKAIAVSNASGNYTQIWYSYITSALNSSGTITGSNLASGGLGFTCSAIKVTGTSSLDKTSSNAAGYSSSTGTLSSTNEIVVGAATCYGTNPTWTESSGFTTIRIYNGGNTGSPAGGNNWGSDSGYQIVSSTASVTYSPTETGCNNIKTGVIASFK